jgi:hypothetical protein
MIERVFLLYLGGVGVTRDAVRGLAGLLDESNPELAVKLRQTLERGTRIVALDEEERAAILAVLHEPPDGLAELRGTLLREWRAA